MTSEDNNKEDILPIQIVTKWVEIRSTQALGLVSDKRTALYQSRRRVSCRAVRGRRLMKGTWQGRVKASVQFTN